METIRKYKEIGDRFCKIRLHFCENSLLKFSDATNIDYRSLSAICSGTRNAGKDVIGRVLEAFPSINKAWLVLGEGEMFNPGAVQHNSGNQNCTITNVDNSTTATEEVTELRSQLKSANETIHALTSMLSTKMTELQSSVDLINKMLNED